MCNGEDPRLMPCSSLTLSLGADVVVFLTTSCSVFPRRREMLMWSYAAEYMWITVSFVTTESWTRSSRFGRQRSKFYFTNDSLPHYSNAAFDTPMTWAMWGYIMICKERLKSALLYVWSPNFGVSVLPWVIYIFFNYIFFIISLLTFSCARLVLQISCSKCRPTLGKPTRDAAL